jgi:hypothetical protein
MLLLLLLSPRSTFQHLLHHLMVEFNDYTAHVLSYFHQGKAAMNYEVSSESYLPVLPL